MPIDFLIQEFEERSREPAVIAPSGRCTFGELVDLCGYWRGELEGTVAPGKVVGLEGDFSPNAVALLLALLAERAIVVPQSNTSRFGREQKDEIAQTEAYFYVDKDDVAEFELTGRRADHRLYDELRRRGNPGMVGFSSGTSGDPKGTVHDFTTWLETFKLRRPAYSTLTFLLFDHLGGTRTLLHALSNGAKVVATRDRSPESVCSLIEEHDLELLPATPTFFNLLLLSGAHRRFDLSSLRVISYGAEPMPQSTLDRLHEAFPGVKLVQTYGLIECGPMRSKSRGDGSLWVSVGGEGIETRVVDGMLQIRTPLMTIGYLNAETPITADGWFITGDAVLQDGDYLRFLGRKSEQINVGGEKVYPAEVEDVIQSMDEVENANVYGEQHRLIGQIVCAKVKLRDSVKADGFARRLKRHCRVRLDRFKVPVKVEIVDETPISERFKKIRGDDGPTRVTAR